MFILIDNYKFDGFGDSKPLENTFGDSKSLENAFGDSKPLENAWLASHENMLKV